MHMGAKAEGARARRRRLTRRQGTKLGLVGGIAATALAVGLTPTLANAASSQTYFVGFPDWLPISDGATLPADAAAIETAVLAAKDRNPLIGWGTGGVDLKPTWITWPDAVPTPDLVPDQTHIETREVPNPAYTLIYQPAYDAAYDAAYGPAKDAAYRTAYDQAYQQAVRAVPVWQTTYNTTADLYRPGKRWLVEEVKVFGRVIVPGVPNPCHNNNACTVQRATAAADEAASFGHDAYDLVAKAAGELAGVQAGHAAGQAAGDASGLDAIADYLAQNPDAALPPTVTETKTVVDSWKVVFHTRTGGQWANPGDLGALPAAAQAAYALYVAQNGDLGAAAPVLNWTTYLTNANLIAYGDGAIATGEAYRNILDSFAAGTYPVGEARTGPRVIRITGPNPEVNVDGTVSDPLDMPFPTPGEMPDYEVVEAGGVLDLTVLSMVLVRNPGRANGGLYSRFAPIYQELTGVNPVSPERQDVLPDNVDPELLAKLLNGDTDDIDMSQLNELGEFLALVEDADGKPMLVTIKADVGWQYDLLSDAPATANPIAWANSIASSIMLTNLITGTDFDNLGDGFKVGPDGTLYYTVPVEELPLLAPLRAPSQLLGLASGDLDPNSPVADALEPMLRILVNSAYTDVQRNADGTWTRTLDEMGTPTLFGTQTLTRAEQALMVGDLIAALGKGVGDELSEALTDIRKAVSEQVELDLPAEQTAAIDEALRAPGTALTSLSRDAGTTVSQGLSAVDQQLPQRPAVTQEQLADGQQQAGEQLADTRNRAEETVEKVDSTVKSVQERLKERAAERAERREAARENIGDATKKVRADVRQARDDVRKTVDKVKADVRKAGEKLRPKRNDAKSTSESSESTSDKKSKDKSEGDS